MRKNVLSYSRRYSPFKESITERVLRKSISQERARSILGKNFFGMEEWEKFYHESFTEKMRMRLRNFPWGEDVLNAPCPFYPDKKIKETHFGFLGLKYLGGLPLNMIKWERLHYAMGLPPLFYSCVVDNEYWYLRENFSVKTCSLRWYLALMETVPGSEKKDNFTEQTAMLPYFYGPASLIEEITKLILYQRKNGIYLNSEKWSQCADVTSYGSRVNVGGYDEEGIDIDDIYVSLPYHGIGIAAFRRR